jgi:hypothetical protein
VLVKNYFAGGTIVEAYWKSVHMPGEGVFVGDPLARPFGTEATVADATLSIKTSIFHPGTTYSLQGSNSASGPFHEIKSGISVSEPSYKVITVPSGGYAFYQLVPVADTTTPK